MDDDGSLHSSKNATERRAPLLDTTCMDTRDLRSCVRWACSHQRDIDAENKSFNGRPSLSGWLTLPSPSEDLHKPYLDHPFKSTHTT
jgi:hypothetical protein